MVWYGATEIRSICGKWRNVSIYRPDIYYNYKSCFYHSIHIIIYIYIFLYVYKYNDRIFVEGTEYDKWMENKPFAGCLENVRTEKRKKERRNKNTVLSGLVLTLIRSRWGLAERQQTSVDVHRFANDSLYRDMGLFFFFFIVYFFFIHHLTFYLIIFSAWSFLSFYLGVYKFCKYI